MNDCLDTIDEQPDPIEDCPCGQQPRYERDGAYHSLYCDNCYDGAPDSCTRNMLGCSTSLGDAIAQWNECVALWLDERADKDYTKALYALERRISQFVDRERTLDRSHFENRVGDAVDKLIQARRNLHRLDRLFPPDEKDLTPK